MKVVRFAEFGVPAEVCRVESASDAREPGDGEVRVEIVAFPINPVDLLTIEGRYATRPKLPAIPGSEALGRVIDSGPGAEHLAPGELVLMMGRENWVERATVPAAATVAVGAAAREHGVDPLQLAMLKINPPTALLMLTRYVELERGDWIAQNAANSAVGIHVARLAHSRGIRTVNVVRREAAAAAVEAAGGDVVVVDGDDLAARVAEATGGARIRLGIDAVAGAATGRLASCLADGATVVNYGLLSGDPCTLAPSEVVFRRITLTGFWLVHFLSRMDATALGELYAGLIGALAEGALDTAVDEIYALDRIGDALAHAARGERSGKVLVRVTPDP